jgi:hypothetical protein
MDVEEGAIAGEAGAIQRWERLSGSSDVQAGAMERKKPWLGRCSF